MTVHSKVKTTLVSIHGILADFESMYLEKSDDRTKALFKDLITETEDALKIFKERVEYIESEEPQYKEEH